MMNRRQFVHATAASVVTFARRPTLLAAGYDLILKGGRVIDPSLRVNAVRDVAITGGRIAAVEADIAADATVVIDATGKIVIPGLLDLHTHYARDADGPLVGLAGGVTGWIDAGSEGADQIDDIVAVARAAPQPGRILINIGRAGILPDGDTMDLSLADVDAAKAGIARHRDFVVGVKARLTRGVAADDVEVLRRAQEVATSFGLPVMIHMGQTASPLPRLLSQLKRGDIVTHMFAPPPNSIIDDPRILPEVLAARRRGVWFDVANGRTGHLRWDTFDGIIQAGFWPDTISTDGSTTSRNAESVIDFPNVMVQVPELRVDVGSGRRPRDHQCVAHLPGVQGPRHAQRGRPGRRGCTRTAGRHVRLCRQLREHADRPPTTLPERDRARRRAGAPRITDAAIHVYL